MSKINKYEAPVGYVAVEPEQYHHFGGECNGCSFLGNHECLSEEVICSAECREDGRDVIFKREGSSGDDSAVASDFLKKSLDILPAAWKAFQQHKEAAKTLHHH